MMIKASGRHGTRVEAADHPIHIHKIQAPIRIVPFRSVRLKQSEPPNTQQSGILLATDVRRAAEPSQAAAAMLGPQTDLVRLVRRRTGKAQSLAQGQRASILVHLGMRTSLDMCNTCEDSRSRTAPKTFGVETQVASPATMVPISPWRSALPVRLVGAKSAAAGSPEPNGECLGLMGWCCLGWIMG